jgi:hypothetical protein
LSTTTRRQECSPSVIFLGSLLKVLKDRKCTQDISQT